jgi:hypothetical protein
MGVFCFTKRWNIEQGEFMSYLKRRIPGAVIGRCLAVLFLMSCSHMAMAQSTIFNIPSTDTVAPKKAYAEFDYLVQVPGPDTPDTNRFQVFAPRIVVGIAPNLEAGANFSFFHTGSTQSLFQPNIKWKFFNSEMKGLAASGGIIWYTPMNNRDVVVDSYGLIYGNFSKKVMGKYGPRITMGPYGIVGADENYVGTKAGAIIGWEQPLGTKVNVVADWFSGVSGFGYFTPGISITLPHNGLFNAGYSIGNDSYNGNKNRALFLYYGITFP